MADRVKLPLEVQRALMGDGGGGLESLTLASLTELLEFSIQWCFGPRVANFPLTSMLEMQRQC